MSIINLDWEFRQMKWTFISLVFLVFCTGCTSNHVKLSNSPKALPVYLLLGQSNMVGMLSVIEELPENLRKTQKNTLFFKNGQWTPLAPGVSEPKGFGPEISFSERMGSTNHPIGIIKLSVGATSLYKDWNPKIDRSLYSQTIEVVEQASKTRDIRIAGILWMQGESDGATPEMANAYADNLKLMIESFRSDLNSPNLPLAACRVTAPASQFPYIETVRKAQQNESAKGYRWFDCDSLTKGPDNLHYDTAGQINLGRMFFEALSKPNGT